ncbi:MAG TPA: insulinase family protein [Micromonospora sp.]|nr:insulinase family protein [Micromonospora sp.]
MAAHPHRPVPYRYTLDNGLRVVLAPEPGALRAAVSVHYGVGFRSERPGREGFAHLFEHLMFQGSASLPDGRFYDHIKRSGGQANGTTHQDYTDYYQVVPLGTLEAALFSEADRMRAPRFTLEGLADQLRGVAEEIDQAVRQRPYGGFPWPLLPGVLFTRHANAHDGYGDPDVLTRITLEDCEEFFDEHYAPGNAVLTVVGDIDVDDVRALVDQHFGDIPPRPTAPRPALGEPLPTADRWVTATETGVPLTALALGYRLPDPATDLDAYLAYLVLARVTAGQAPRFGLPGLTTSCGIFGAFDARDPDVLVVATLLPPARAPEQAAELLRAQWARWGEADALVELVRDNVPLLVAAHHREHAQVEAYSRALGRMVTLFDDAELLDALPQRLAAVRPDQVAAVARELATAPHGALVMAPGQTRTRPAAPAGAPAPAQTARPEGAAGSAGSDGTAASVLKVNGRQRGGPRPVPVDGPQLAPDPAGLRSGVLGNGLRVCVVPDRRAPLAEFRLRLPLGPEGWTRPDLVAGLLGVLGGAADRFEPFAGNLQVTTDGQWLDLGGYAPAAVSDRWLATVADLVTVVSGIEQPTPAPSRTPATPERHIDDVVRQRWLEAGTSPAADPDPAGTYRRILDPRGAVLTVVGDVDPGRTLAAAGSAFDGWAAAGQIGVPPAVSEPGGLLVIPAPAGTEVHLTVAAPERPEGDEAARFLAASVVGGGPEARISVMAAGNGYQAHVGRDVCGPVSRAFIRVRCAPEAVVDVLADLDGERRRLRAEPLTDAEIDRAREYTAVQLLSAFDSPSILADLMSHLVSSGREPDWLYRLPDLLRKVPAADVAAAAVDLYAGSASCTVVYGGTDEALAAVRELEGGPDARTR